MFYVYGLQVHGESTGAVKIGFSHKPRDRLLYHEQGALGERLQIIFQTQAGETYSEGYAAEYAYHKHFADLRISREWFKFDPEMLVWAPTNTIQVDRDTFRSPAVNWLLQTLPIGTIPILPTIRQPPIYTTYNLQAHKIATTVQVLKRLSKWE